MKKFLLFSLFFCQAALAAQVGQVIVDDAPIYEYPQFSSKLLSKLKKGDSVPVSNIPTEGFYKVRLKNGDLGWVSGNDVLVTPVNESSSSANGPAQATPQPRVSQKPKNDYPTDADASDDDSEESPDPNTRILLGMGLESLSYNGLSSNFEGVAALNYGNNVGLEIQRRLWGNLFWAIRAEVLYTSSGAFITSNGSTQTMTELNLPLELGLNFSIIDSRKLRLALGAYGGVSPFSYVTVQQIPISGTGASNSYKTVDPVVTGALQITYSFGRSFGFFGEVSYRYEKTDLFPAAPLVGTTNIPSFAIDYSGIMGRLGLEFRF